jgi:PAS domain S-box-containing protein
VNVLIVDDQLINQKLLHATLEAEGHTVVEATNGVEALQLLESQPTDAIISDILMPRMDGYRLCSEVRKRKKFKHLPFIHYTATYTSPSDERLSSDLGADIFLRKPASAEEIIGALRQVTDKGHEVRATSAPAESDVMKEYSERLVAKLEHKNLELVRALNELESERSRLRHLLEHSPAVIYALKIEGQKVTPVVVGENIERLLGITAAEATSYEWWAQSLHPEDRDRVLAVLTKSLTKDGYSMEYRIRHKDGSYHWFEDNNRVVRDESGHAKESVGVWTDITERKKASETLQRLRRQRELILNSAGEGIHGLDLEGKVVFSNPKGAQLLGWSADELLGKPFHATIQHTQRDGCESRCNSSAIYASIHDGGTRRVTNDAFWRKDGTSFRVDYVSAPIKDEQGRITGCIVTFKDITDQVMAEARQKLQAEQYRLLFETNPSSMWVFETKSLRILAVNEAAIAQYGYSREEFLKLNLKDLLPVENIYELEKSLSPADSGAAFSGRIRHVKRDGSRILVEIYSGPIIWEGASARITTGINVTERQRAEDRLREQARLLDLAHDAIMVRDMEDRVEFWNHGAEKLYGWTAGEVQGRKASSFLYQDEPAATAAARASVIENGEWTGECKHNSKDGDSITVRSRWTLVRDELEAPKSILIINTDVTEQKKLEAHLLRAQRLESIGTLASGVAHDLNNILTPILMCAEILREDPDAEDAALSIDLIEESAKRGASVVKQVLTFARGVEGEQVVIKPTHLIQEMIDIAQKTFPKTIQIIGRYPDDLWSIKCDPTQLHQVLLNLSVNARDAMPNGGSLTLGAENFTVDENYAAMTPGATAGSYVMLRVSDSGLGMPRATVDKIFDPFFTTKEVGKGTGLGLSTALGIVKSHSGFLSVDSELGKGTTFRIFLPATVSSEELQKSKTVGAPIQGNGEQILIVDDEPNILEITKRIFEKHNYRVISASDGTEALALFAQQMDSIGGVLTDIAMPYMNGVALVRALRRMKSDIPIVASTGQGDQPGVADLRSLGVTNFLTKPYNTEKLLMTLKTAMEKQSSS